MTTRKTGDKWLDYDAVCAVTTLSTRSINRLMAAGDFPIRIKLGSRYVFKKLEIEAWMTAMENRRKAKCSY